MTTIDRLRTAYVHAPSSLRRSLSPLFAAMPVRYRFGSTYTAYREHIERSRHDLEFVAKWRSERLRTLVQAAVRVAPHYQRVAAQVGIDARTLDRFDVGDLARFPIIGKDDVRRGNSEFLTMSPDQLDAVSTSGSSGVPLNLFLDKDRSAKEFAFQLDSWSKIGFHPRHTRAVFRGLQWDNIDQTPWFYEPALGELRLSPFHLTDAWMEKYCALILRHGATYLHGYPSAIAIFSKYVLRAGRIDVANAIAGAIAMSEPFYDHQRQLIAEAFPKAKSISFYGMSEKVLFGSEVSGDPSVIEMEPLYGIAEIVDDHGNTIDTPGEKGRIIGTGILWAGMPLIRYDTGDQAILVEAPSEKNLFRLKVKGLTSRRAQEFLVGSDGQLISLVAVCLHSANLMKLSAFQFYQSVPGRATLKAVLAPGYGKSDIDSFVKETSTKIGTSMSFDIEIVSKIPQNMRGKAKLVDQQIDLGEWQ